MKKVIIFLSLILCISLLSCTSKDKPRRVAILIDSKTEPLRDSMYSLTQTWKVFQIEGLDRFEEPDSLLQSKLKQIKKNDSLVVRELLWGNEENEIRVYPLTVKIPKKERMIFSEDGYTVKYFKRTTYTESTKVLLYLKKQYSTLAIGLFISLFLCCALVVLSFQTIKNTKITYTLLSILLILADLYIIFSFCNILFFLIVTFANILIPTTVFFYLKKVTTKSKPK